ncbi:MAG TPA: nickel-dependent lactate racemase [Firmicutes bacterium]|nr:nickel-dependent lactate racemase [Bacillota bacterium]
MGKIYTVSYGTAKIAIELPSSADVQVLEMGEHPPVPDAMSAAMEALANPVGSIRLRDKVKPGSRVCVIIPDRTRALPVKVLLKATLDELHAGGVKKGDVTIVFALGTHREMSEIEMLSIVGDQVFREYRCMNHDWMDERNLVHLGRTPNGTPISVNRVVYDADVRVAIGGVNPHRVAGWSGGAKAIQPGVCGADTTGATHWLSACIPAEEIYGMVHNPVRSEMESVASRVGLEFIINCVVNKRYEPVAIYAGDFIQAHRMCVEVGKRVYAVDLPEEKDVVICGTGPYATDMWNVGCGPSELVVKPGGAVVVLAPCPDGVSSQHPEVIKYGYRRSLDEVRRLVEEGKICDLSAAAHLIHAGSVLTRKGATCILVSEGVSEAEARALGLGYARTAQEAIDRTFARYGSKVTVGLYPGDSPTNLFFRR